MPVKKLFLAQYSTALSHLLRVQHSSNIIQQYFYRIKTEKRMRCFNRPFVFFHLKHHILFFANRILLMMILQNLYIRRKNRFYPDLNRKFFYILLSFNKSTCFLSHCALIGLISLALLRFAILRRHWCLRDAERSSGI